MNTPDITVIKDIMDIKKFIDIRNIRFSQY